MKSEERCFILWEFFDSISYHTIFFASKKNIDFSSHQLRPFFQEKYINIDDCVEKRLCRYKTRSFVVGFAERFNSNKTHTYFRSKRLRHFLR